MAVRDASESVSIMYWLEDWMMGWFRILYRHCRIASSSAVDVEDEFLRRKDTIC